MKKPTQINLTNGRSITMQYDGQGNLLKRTFSTGEVWEYSDGLTYHNGQVFDLPTPEGRAVFTKNQWAFEFFYSDHLGNTRLSFSKIGNNLSINDISDFDPTGVIHRNIGAENTIANQYKFQGKEVFAQFGLAGIHDFGARYLDKTIGRWQGADFLGDFNASISPMNYVNGDLINLIDPDGLSSSSSQSGGDQDMVVDNSENYALAYGFLSGKTDINGEKPKNYNIIGVTKTSKNWFNYGKENEALVTSDVSFGLKVGGGVKFLGVGNSYEINFASFYSDPLTREIGISKGAGFEFIGFGVEYKIMQFISAKSRIFETKNEFTISVPLFEYKIEGKNEKKLFSKINDGKINFIKSYIKGYEFFGAKIAFGLPITNLRGNRIQISNIIPSDNLKTYLTKKHLKLKK